MLIDRWILTRDECNEIVFRLIRDELFELVFWQNALFTVHGQTPPGEIYEADRDAIHGSVDNAELSADVTAWLEDWLKLQNVLHSDRTVVKTTEAGHEAAATLASAIRQLLDECKEERSLHDLWLRAGPPLNDLCKSVVRLGEKKLLTLTPDRSRTRRSPAEEIATLEESLRHLIAKDLVRTRLVSLYRRTKQLDKAVEHLEILAGVALAANDAKEASEHLKQILNVEPQNVKAFESLIDINRKSKLIKEIKNFGLNHLQRLAERSLYREADRCARFLERLPNVGTEVLEFKASLLASRGKTKEAAVEYMRIAKLYDDKGDIALASYLYRKAATYDRQSPSTSDQVDGSEGQAEGEGSNRVEPDAKQPEKPRVSPRGSPRGDYKRLVAAVLLIAVAAGVYWRDKLISAWIPQEQTPTALATSPRADRPTATGTSLAREDDNAAVRIASEAPSSELAEPEADLPHGVAACDDPTTFHTRILSSTQEARYADSCRMYVTEAGGRTVHEFPGETGTRWAVGYSGWFICRWQAGKRPTVFTLPDGVETSLKWRIPEFADALAVGEDRIVIRQAKLTVMFTFDGTRIYDAELPLWEEGLMEGRHLILTRSRSKTRMLWLVEADSLDLLWTCRNEPDGLVVW